MSEPNVVIEVLDLEIEELKTKVALLEEARETLVSLLPTSAAPKRTPPAKRKTRRTAKPARASRRAAIARSAARAKKGGASGGCGSDAEGHGGDLRRVSCISCGAEFVRCANHNRAKGSVKALLEAHKRVCGKEA